MEASTSQTWPETRFCLALRCGQNPDFTHLATDVYERVCRTDFLAPGFCLLDLGGELSSTAFRQFMVSLLRALGEVHQARRGGQLAVLSAARFDQQVTTKFHRDGGPDECFLMLGYEPSAVRAELRMADYSKCAFDMGLTPSLFLQKHNPMYSAGARLLDQYTTRVTCFDHRHYQLLLVNNSVAACAPDAPAWQGVLHTATILSPDSSLRRVVNSMMIASVAEGNPEAVTERALDEFVQTSLVRRRGYDRGDLEDDA